MRSQSDRNKWLAAARQATIALGGLAVVALAWTLGLEVHFHVPDGTPMDVWAIVSVAAALLGLAAGCIGLAVVPGVYFSRFGANWIRFSYALDPKDTAAAAARLWDSLESL